MIISSRRTKSTAPETLLKHKLSVLGVRVSGTAVGQTAGLVSFTVK